jgi:cobalt-zinc-cadmium efflux system outer membrane protein
MRGIFPFSALLLVLLATGCASTSAAPAFREVGREVEGRTGKKLSWITGSEEDEQVRKAVRELLSRELSVDGAVQVALLNNRHLQAMYEDLGVAQADLVQAGLLKNPVLGGEAHWPLDKGGGSTFELNLVQDFIALFTLGARKRIAKAQLEGAKLRVGNAVLQVAYETKVSFYGVQAAQQMLAMRKVIAEAAAAGVELAQKQHKAETINDLTLANEQSLFAQIQLDVRRAEADLAAARERLNRAMGAWGPDTGWRASPKLPEVTAEEPSFEHIESFAVARRLDLGAARKDVEVVSYGLALAKNVRWIGGLDAGITLHRETEGVRLIGPSVSLQIPLFDQGQAVIARLEAQLREVKAREYAMAVEVRSEVRELRARLAASRGIVESYQRSIVPLRERIVALSQQQYDAMLLGVFQLLAAKQSEISAYRELIEAVRDYWTLRAELEWRAGGALPGATHGTTLKSNEEHHHDHP